MSKALRQEWVGAGRAKPSRPEVYSLRYTIPYYSAKKAAKVCFVAECAMETSVIVTPSRASVSSASYSFSMELMLPAPVVLATFSCTLYRIQPHLFTIGQPVHTMDDGAVVVTFGVECRPGCHPQHF